VDGIVDKGVTVDRCQDGGEIEAELEIIHDELFGGSVIPENCPLLPDFYDVRADYPVPPSVTLLPPEDLAALQGYIEVERLTGIE
jgi:hypothetical protein